MKRIGNLDLLEAEGGYGVGFVYSQTTMLTRQQSMALVKANIDNMWDCDQDQVWKYLNQIRKERVKVKRSGSGVGLHG